MASWLKILHYRKLIMSCDTIAKALESSKDAMSTQLSVLFTKIYLSLLSSHIFFWFIFFSERALKRVLFCKIKVKYLLFPQSLLLEYQQHFSLLLSVSHDLGEPDYNHWQLKCFFLKPKVLHTQYTYTITCVHSMSNSL